MTAPTRDLTAEELDLIDERARRWIACQHGMKGCGHAIAFRSEVTPHMALMLTAMARRAQEGGMGEQRDLTSEELEDLTKLVEDGYAPSATSTLALLTLARRTRAAEARAERAEANITLAATIEHVERCPERDLGTCGWCIEARRLYAYLEAQHGGRGAGRSRLSGLGERHQAHTLPRSRERDDH